MRLVILVDTKKRKKIRQSNQMGNIWRNITLAFGLILNNRFAQSSVLVADTRRVSLLARKQTWRGESRYDAYRLCQWSDAYNVEYKTKEKSLKTKKLFANNTYYKLRAGKQFGYYIIGLGDKGYGISSAEEILEVRNPQGALRLENHEEGAKVRG